MHVIHYGVQPTDGGAAVMLGVIGGFYDAYDADAPLMVAGHPAFVSGSWAEWGIDPDAHHDGSLHVAVNVDGEIDHAECDRITDAVRTMVTGGRLMDYAVISTDEWSDQVAHVTTGPGRTYLDRLA